MIKIYVMESCPDCTQVKAQAKNDPNYEVIDIGDHVKNLKEFIHLRDTNPAFDEAKRSGSLGIPCFVREDGSISFAAEEFVIEEVVSPACRLDGKGGC